MSKPFVAVPWDAGLPTMQARRAVVQTKLGR